MGSYRDRAKLKNVLSIRSSAIYIPFIKTTARQNQGRSQEFDLGGYK